MDPYCVVDHLVTCFTNQDIIAFYEKLPYKPTEWGANYKLKSPTFSFDTPAC